MRAWRRAGWLCACAAVALALPTEDEFRKAITARPTDAAAQSRYGLFLLQQGRPPEALTELRAALALSPRSPDHTYNLALALLQTEAPAEALAVLERGKFPGADHLALRGNVLNALDRLPEAATALRRAATLDAGNVDTLYDLALTLLKLDAAAEALPWLEQGRRRFPREAKIHAASGMAAYALGRNAEAIRFYETAVHLEPAAPDLHAALGDVRQAAGDLSAAEGAYRRSLRLEAGAAVSVKLGRNLARQQRAAEAAAAFTRAIQLEPGHAEGRLELGKLALTAGDPAGAVEHLRQAVRSAPDLKSAWYQLGIAYQRAGEEESSRQAMEQFRRIP